jgi:hypothetical protein
VGELYCPINYRNAGVESLKLSNNFTSWNEEVKPCEEEETAKEDQIALLNNKTFEKKRSE